MQKLLLVLLILLFSSLDAIAEDCKQAVELYNKGTLSKDFKKKESYFKKAIPLCSDPEILSRVYNNLADTYEKQGKLSLALKWYKKALKIKPDLSTSYFSVGDIFFKLGDYYSAYIMYGKGLRYEPDDNESFEKREMARDRFKKKMIVYFDFDSSKIPEHYKYRLDLISQAIRNNFKRKIKVIGHTCNIGPKAYNKRLSIRRAQSVAHYLRVHLSINREVIAVIGMGEESPLLPNTDKNARVLNRRVEIIVLQ